MMIKNSYEKDDMIKNQKWVFKNEENEVLAVLKVIKGEPNCKHKTEEDFSALNRDHPNRA